MRIFWLLTLLGLSRADWDWDEPTDLDNYVNSAEAVYGYEVLNIFPVTGATVHVLNMTSLTWFDDTLTTTPVWWHYQLVVVPDNIVYTDAAMMYIYGGDMDDPMPSETDGEVQDCIRFSVNTGAVSSLLKMIPNQPLYFVSEDNGTNPRTEDAIIGYSWKLFIEQTVDDTTVDALFPMTKAAKMGVDTLINYAASVDPTLIITEIMPTGFSKRGWTTGLLTTTDQRVFASCPVVIDILNWYPNLMHHHQSMGGWSWAFGPYWNNDIPYYINHPRTKIMADLIDPYEYKVRLTMPKLWHAGTGDQFFLPDDTHYWLANFTGETHYMIFENDDHGLGDHRDILWQNEESFFIMVKEGIPRPEYSYVRDDMSDPGTITFTSVTPPLFIRAWVAENTNRTCEPDDDISGICRRDFRFERLNIPVDTLIEWREEPVLDLGGGQYAATYNHRSDFGFRIFHIEAAYPGPGGREFHVSSEVSILPNIMPYPPCVTPEECQGVLK